MTSTTERHGSDATGVRTVRKSIIEMNRSIHHNATDHVDGNKPAKKSSLFVLTATILILGGAGLIGYLGGWFHSGGPANHPPTTVPIPSQYDPDRVMSYLVRLCEFGPRPSGSPAMKAQQEYLESFFTERGAVVSFQRLEIRHPEDGSAVPIANLIASWGSDRPKRFLMCAHYDTRPYPDQDRHNPRGTFIGANDGASGTAALMELSHQFASLPDDVGIDIVLFDGEEFVWKQGRDDYFIGSNYFAENYKANPPAISYQSGVLLDMIGDRELRIYYEQNSIRYAREVTRSVWRTAKNLGVQAFVPRARHTISDDHIPLNQIAKIPTTDLIDFDYPRPGIGAPSYWHTENDVPANCSGESMAAVVWVVHQWILSQ
jgi:hypothetical protein